MLAHVHRSDLAGVLVPWIQQNIERLRHHRGRHAQQCRTPCLKPSISRRTCEIGSFEPVGREICRRHVLDNQIVRRMKLQQAVARGQIANVNLEMNQDLQ